MSENERGSKEEKKGRRVKEEESFGISSVVFDITGTMLTAVIILLVIMSFFVRQVTVDGPSMNNTLQHEDRLLVSCFNYTPQNGDIVIITHGKNLDEAIVKRVIATEGQHLTINYETNEVVVDGVLLDEEYTEGTTIPLHNPTQIPDVIPEGYVFVMGDNREHSLDSRSVNVDLIPVQNIIGKAFMRIYPFSSFGAI